MRPSTALPLIAGLATHAVAQPAAQPPDRPFIRVPDAPAPRVVHFDAATGVWTHLPERGLTSPGEGAVWFNTNDSPCDPYDLVAALIDDADTDGDGFGNTYNTPCDGSGTSPCYDSWHLWWGDIPADTVVDRVVVSYYTYIMDTPCDEPSDGVEGCDLYIAFNDADNGRDDPNRKCITEIRVPSIPGVGTDCGSIVPKALFYLLVIDLAPSQVFEIGDSDGVDDAGSGISGGAIYGEPTFADPDDDGLHDFSWALRLDQSGVPQSERGFFAYTLVAPKLGSPNDDAPHPADARGLEDLSDIFWSGPSCPPASTGYIGAFNFVPGFTCEGDPPRPYESCYLSLYGPTAPAWCGLADVAEPFGVLDFSDVLAFLTAFAEGREWVTRLAPSGCCTPNFADVVAYLDAFAAGCL